MAASRPEPAAPASRAGAALAAPARLLTAAVLALVLVPALGPVPVLAPMGLHAQEEARPRLSGEVVRNGEPMPGVTVVLHRVTPEDAGPVDSVRADAGGGFAIDLPSVPDPGGRGEVYFASVRHDDIMYFGAAIHEAVELDSAYVIEVSDAVPAPLEGAELPVSMRHVILEEVEGGWRVTELLQVSNEGGRTLVAQEGGITWSYPLPETATDVEVGGDEVPPGEAEATGGRYRVSAAIPPGERQFLVRYRVAAPEVTFPAPGTTRRMELLVREPAPPLEVDGLAAVESVEMQPGSSFRRYVGTDLLDTRVVLEPGQEGGGGLSVRWLAVILGLVLAAAGVWAVLRPREGPVGVPAGAGPTAGPTGTAEAGAARRALLVEVARIDEALDGGKLPEAEASALRRRRAELVERLRSFG